LSGSVAALLAAFVSTFGLFAYGFITWSLKRLVNQLDNMQEALYALKTRVTVIESERSKHHG